LYKGQLGGGENLNLKDRIIEFLNLGQLIDNQDEDDTSSLHTVVYSSGESEVPDILASGAAI